MASIFLVRHGQASFGSSNYDVLSPLGEKQAKVAGEYFRDSGIEFDAMYCGSLKRQIDTASIVAASQRRQPQLNLDERFNEIRVEEQFDKLLPIAAIQNPTALTLMKNGLKSGNNYQKVLEILFFYWVSNDCSEVGIQTWAEYSAAVSAALQDVIVANGRGKTLGIFTSGGTIATAVAHILELSGHSAYKFYEPVTNCSITRLIYSSDRVSVVSINDYSYLAIAGANMDCDLVSYR